MPTPTPPPHPPPQALIFDLMGTLLNWHASITPALISLLSADNHNRRDLPHESASQLALQWRQAFFDEIHARFERGEGNEDIDVTHRRVLLEVLGREGWRGCGEEGVEECVRAWHKQCAWADVGKALAGLRGVCDVVVLANGTTRLQVDVTKSAGLQFDMLFSSELLSMTKPDPAIYLKAVELLQHEPSECMMVAAHAYDLRAAKKVGMRTAYLQRWTEDVNEDMQRIKDENEIFIDARQATAESGGLLELAKLLGFSTESMREVP